MQNKLDRKAEYTNRVNDYLTQVVPYRDKVTTYPKVPKSHNKLYAANMEFVVYCDDCSEIVPDQLVKAYQLIMTYRFPMRLNPLNTPKIEALTEDERELLYHDEAEFIVTKLREINPAFCISTIPKSLYQLLFYIACEKEQETAFDKNNTFFKATPRSNYVPVINDEYNDYNSVANITHPVFGFGYNNSKTFTNPNDNDNYFQHCLTYLACPIATQEWYNANLFLIKLLGDKGLLNADFRPNQLRRLTEWAFDSIAKGTEFHNYRYRRSCLMSTERSRKNLFNHEEKQEYLRGIASTIVLREWDLREKNCHSIYRGGDENKLEMHQEGADYSYSFSDGLFGGLFYDCINGMAFKYTLAGYCYLKDLSIAKFGTSSDEARRVFLPPVPAFAASLGVGEFHHPRTTYSKESMTKGKVEGVSFFGDNSKSIPASLVSVLTSQNETCADNNAACAEFFKDITRISLYGCYERPCITIM